MVIQSQFRHSLPRSQLATCQRPQLTTFLSTHRIDLVITLRSCNTWLKAGAIHLAMEVDGDNLLAKGVFIAESLYKHCFLPDQGARIKKTGSLSPGTSLKSKDARASFQWAADVGLGKKFFTMAACRKGVQLFLSKPGVQIPFCGLPANIWVEAQSKHVMRLAQRARRNCGASLRFRAYNQAKLMDFQETLPLEAGWHGSWP